MAYSVILSDGTTSYQFVYNPSSQTDFKMYYGMKVSTGEPEALWHSPDSDERKLIRLVDQPGTIFITQTVKGGGAWDNVINNVTDISRMVKQAAQYQTDGNVNRVYVRIQPDGATRYTDYEVIYGHVDASGSYYKSVDVLNAEATGVVLSLNVRAYGEGAPITLRNDLSSSPHFVQDSNGDGLADGWTLTGTPPTAIETTKWLVGGKSQSFQAPTTGDAGINKFKGGLSGGESIVAYAWINFGSGSDSVYVMLQESGATTNLIQEKQLTRANPLATADKSMVDSAGATWYRVVLSGTAHGSATGVQLRIRRKSADAATISVFNVDATYLQTGTTTAPDAWCSTSAIQNRNDPASTSSATEAQINYLDVWGVPGDSDAVVKTSVTLGSVSRTTIMASRHSDGEILAANVDHWIESDELTTVSASGTWSTGTGTSDNHYQRFTEGGSPGANSRAYISLTGSSARALLKYPRRIFALARSSSTTSQFVGVSTVAGELNLTDKTKTSDTGTGVATVNTWELLDLGLINGYGLMPSAPPIDAEQEVFINIYVQSAPSSSTNDIDALLLPVLGDEFAIWVGKEETRSSGGEIIFDGTAKAVVSAASGIYEQPTGGLWYAAAGKMNRYVFAVVDSDNVFAIADTMSVSFTVYPRTRHLLGTS